MAEALASNEDSASALDTIMASADEKLQSGSLRKPTIDEYIDRVRRERIDHILSRAE